jgi:hypothetical protein
LQLTIQQSSGAGTELRTHKFEKIAFSDELPPIEALQALLPRVLKEIGVDSAVASPTASAGLVPLPEAPSKLLSDTSDPGRNAYYLQVLAALAPARAERTRERLIEKSLLALQRVPRDSAEYRALKARAYVQLGLRVAALKALGEPKSAEDHYLVALANGNLPEAQRLAEQMPAEKALLTALDLNALAAEYGARTQQQSLSIAQGLKLPGAVWPALAARAFTDWDGWSQFDNAQLKVLLDSELPVPGYTLESLVRGVGALGDMSRVRTEVSLSVLSHVRQAIELNGVNWCCQPLAAKLTALDYLDLFEAIGTDNLMRAATFLTRTQGTPERALEMLGQIESTYKDHPQFAVAKAAAEFASANRTSEPAKQGLLRSAHSHAMHALLWEQGQTLPASDALALLFKMPFGADRAYFDNPYAGDYPFKGFYADWEGGGNRDRSVANMRLALANTSVEFRPVQVLNHTFTAFVDMPEEVERLLRSIENRFHGHPERALLFAENARKRGDAATAERHYREGIEAQPHGWSAYLKLGTLLLEEGDEEKAAKAFLSYPGFKHAESENRVGVANNAYDAGSLLFWSGHFRQAVPLYRIAAGLDTGSESSLASEQRLQLLEGDYQKAVRIALERSQRYRSQFALRDYFGLLHAMGYSEQAWAGFNAVVGQLDQPQLLETALVGHRKEKLTEQQIAAWARQDSISKLGEHFGHGVVYLARAGVTDRQPSDQFASLVESLERPVFKSSSATFTHVFRHSTRGSVPMILGPKARGISYLPRGGGMGKPEQVTSDLVYFVRGYAALRRMDFAGARAQFEEASTLYDFGNPYRSYMLPYYAFAAAKSGNLTALDTLLQSLEPEYRRFDYHLAKAVIAGLGGKIDESLAALKVGLHRRPFTESRPLYTEYQFAEIAEWLYEATKDARFRDVMLRWARANQAFTPWFAWPHAMVAKYSGDASERRKAIALAHYLDLHSEHLAAIPKKQVEAAALEFKALNPFLRAASAQPRKDQKI